MTANEKYPKRMIVQYPHGLMQWVRDYGVVGAYQPMTSFESSIETHTQAECESIRSAYRGESASVVMIGGNMVSVTIDLFCDEAAPDWQQIMDAEFDFTQPSGVIGNSDSDFDVENYK